MSTYLHEAGEDTERARELYLWDRDLAVAFLADLAILEVALRNAMSAQLETRWGAAWYENLDMPLDDRSMNTLNQAWKRAHEPKTPGKIVAQCMFGFWRGLLDKGTTLGKLHAEFAATMKFCGAESSTKHSREDAPKPNSRISAGIENMLSQSSHASMS